MSITDTHAHLDFPDFETDRDQVIERAKQNRVEQIITIGIGRKSITQALRLAETFSSVFAVVGVHPNDLDKLPLADWDFLIKASQHPRVVGIGETGLDYYRLKPPNLDEQKAEQKDYFLRQLQLAKDSDKPVVIHCREAYDDTLGIIKEFGTFRNAPGVMHCFGGSQKIATEVFNLGYYISAGGILTFKNAEEVREIVKGMPRDRLLLETDCPFLAPVPHRGKRNEPAFTKLVAEKVSELWEMPFEQTLEQIASNVKRLFGV
jgi:TatD DNase family protein